MNGRTTGVTLAAAATSAALVLAGCSGGSSSTDSSSSSKALKCDFPKTLVDAAKDEGSVTIYAGGNTREGFELLQQVFKKTYGITVTGVRQDSESIVRMLEAERAANKLNADVVSLVDVAAMAELAGSDALVDSEAPNLAEIRLGLDDPASPQVPYVTAPLGVAYNSSSDVEAPKSWDELAEYDGKIAVADPNSSGTALIFFALLKNALGEEWLPKLASGDITVTDSSLALAQLVLTGEADLALPAIETAVLAAAQGGEPLAAAFPSGGVPTLVAEVGALAKSPHPNAAKLLVGFHLCRDFQTKLAEIGGRPVLVDAPAAKGIQDLSGETELTADLGELQEQAEPLRAEFTKLFK